MQATVQVFVGVVGENPHPNFGKIGVSLGLEYFWTLNFLGRLVEFRSAVRLCGEGRATGPPESDTAAAQRSILDTRYQGEEYALHDDHVPERLRKRETRLGTRPQRHGSNGQVQRGTRESRRAARARRTDPALDHERARHLQRRKIESDRRSVYRSEGSGRRLLDHPGEVARRGARMGLAHPRKG